MGSRRDWSSCRKRVAFRYCSRDPVVTPHYRQWAKSSLSEKLNSLYQSLLKPSARTVLKPPHQKNRTKSFWYFVQFHRNLWKNSIYLCICLHSVREKHQEGVSDEKRDPICKRQGEKMYVGIERVQRLFGTKIMYTKSMQDRWSFGVSMIINPFEEIIRRAFWMEKIIEFVNVSVMWMS